jgi:hypothetical protein
MNGHRRFAPMAPWTLPGCGKPWTAAKSNRHGPAHRFPRALGKPAHGRPFPAAPTGRIIRTDSGRRTSRTRPLERPGTTDYRRFAPTA